MKFKVIENNCSLFSYNTAKDIINVCLQNGDQLTDDMDEVNYILNFTTFENPRAVRRRSKSVFVVSVVADGEHLKDDLRSICYTTLIRTLSNQFVFINQMNEVWFTTPEAGFYSGYYDPSEIYRKILPVISAHFATDNKFHPDLPQRFYNESETVREIRHYGKVLDELGVLPVPFPLKDYLSEQQMNHIYKIFGITGASYGNLSAREYIPEFGTTAFWMTGRGVNKSDLKEVGRDILLVKDFNVPEGIAYLSMPVNYYSKARVSVDAIEHYLIYRNFPEVKAIVHVHAWIEGVISTEQNFPCGTRELAEEVVSLLEKTEDPASAEIGLVNHGLTITGHSLREIFERITGKLVTQVVMSA
ncbi:MAG TPA: class II aldolase/adducin family protein [Ignavibacteriaceae bacterium]|nr:class II aldolase/adducin family protein [Ignavibacteriaceae bacterium]